MLVFRTIILIAKIYSETSTELLLFNIRVNTARGVASKFRLFDLFDSSSRGC